jgi:cytochrome b
VYGGNHQTKERQMNQALLRVAATLHIAGVNFKSAVHNRRQLLKEDHKERGSLTLEQIIWTVGIALVAAVVLAIVVAAINSKAAELPGG